MVQLSLCLLMYVVSFSNALTSYKDGDKVEVYVNKVGPYFNPHETYHYYSLPVCRPKEIKHKSLTLGEVLDGDRMAYSMYEIHFMKNEKDKLLCEMKLEKQELDQLKEAVEELYYFEMVADEIPIRSFLGQFTERGFLAVPHTHELTLFNHITFHFTYNNDKVCYCFQSCYNYILVIINTHIGFFDILTLYPPYLKPKQHSGFHCIFCTFLFYNSFCLKNCHTKASVQNFSSSIHCASFQDFICIFLLPAVCHRLYF